MTRIAGLTRRGSLVKGTIAGVFFFAATALKTYPLIQHFGTHIPDGPGDPLLVSWILAWDFHALTTDPWHLFDANILTPAEHTLAFSEHLIGVVPFFAPTFALTGNPILGYDVAFFLSFPLSGMSMYLLVQYWTRNFWASLISGMLFAFTPVRFAQISHLHLLNFYWAPLTLLFLDRFLRSKRWSCLIGFAMCYWLQVLCSVYLGWFVTITIALYVLYYVSYVDRDLLSRWMLPRYVMFATASLVVLLPFHLPYFVVQQQWGVTRPVTECVVYSADLFLSYLSVPELMNDVYRSLFRFATPSNAAAEKTLFPGFVLAVLIALSGHGVAQLLPSERRGR
jgi:hypothetical protein